MVQFEFNGCLTHSKLPWESRTLTNRVLFIDDRQHHLGVYVTLKNRSLSRGNESALIEQFFVVDSFDSRTGTDSCPAFPVEVTFRIIELFTMQEKLRSYTAKRPSLVTRNCVANGSRTLRETSLSTFISGRN